MKCFKCGYCCTQLFAIVPIDIEKELIEDNIKAIGLNGPEACHNLRGNKCGELSCAAHSKEWYKETPCFEYGDENPLPYCRMGKAITTNETFKFQREQIEQLISKTGIAI